MKHSNFLLCQKFPKDKIFLKFPNAFENLSENIKINFKIYTFYSLIPSRNFMASNNNNETVTLTIQSSRCCSSFQKKLDGDLGPPNSRGVFAPNLSFSSYFFISSSSPIFQTKPSSTLIQHQRLKMKHKFPKTTIFP